MCCADRLCVFENEDGDEDGLCVEDEDYNNGLPSLLLSPLYYLLIPPPPVSPHAEKAYMMAEERRREVADCSDFLSLGPEFAADPSRT